MLYIKKGFPTAQMIREVIQIKSTPEWKNIKEGDTKAIRAKFDELSKEPIRESLLKEQERYVLIVCAELKTVEKRQQLNI